jgi:hypothetical protein
MRMSMQPTGTLRAWNEDKGFGFVVHKAMGAPQSHDRPNVRPNVQPRARPHASTQRHPTGRVGKAVALLLLVSLGAYAFSRYQGDSWRFKHEALPTQADVREIQSGSPSGHHCEGRTTCSQMTSCGEATWFINHCPGTEMDGNHDGVPCEQQWCASPLSS